MPRKILSKGKSIAKKVSDPTKVLGKIKQGISGSNFLSGTPAEYDQVSTLLPEQQPLYQQAVNAGLQGGQGGGAFGQAADYYRGLLDEDSEDYNAFAAPQIRQYKEQFMPDLAEQFAGMGAGGLNSSGFRNAQIQGATDLNERLGAMRANLRNQGAQGLMGIGQQGLQNYSQGMTTKEGSPGFLSSVAPAVGTGVGAFFGGIPGALAGNKFGEQAANMMPQPSPASGNKLGANTSPYGGNSMMSSPLMNRR